MGLSSSHQVGPSTSHQKELCAFYQLGPLPIPRRVLHPIKVGPPISYDQSPYIPYREDPCIM